MLTTVLAGMISWVGLAPVGLGSADWMPPQAAQEPMATMAAAPSVGLADVLYLGLAADLAVDAAVLGRRRPFGDQDVLAALLLHDLVLVGLGPRAGAYAQGLVILQRDHVQDQGLERGVVGAQQGLGAAGTLLAVEPDDRRPLRGGAGGFRHPDAGGRGQAHGRRDARAECEELPSGHPHGPPP